MDLSNQCLISMSKDQAKGQNATTKISLEYNKLQRYVVAFIRKRGSRFLHGTVNLRRGKWNRCRRTARKCFNELVNGQNMVYGFNSFVLMDSCSKISRMDHQGACIKHINHLKHSRWIFPSKLEIFTVVGTEKMEQLIGFLNHSHLGLNTYTNTKHTAKNKHKPPIVI